MALEGFELAGEMRRTLGRYVRLPDRARTPRIFARCPTCGSELDLVKTVAGAATIAKMEHDCEGNRWTVEM